MPKSKEQKKLEADFRKVRGDLVQESRDLKSEQPKRMIQIFIEEDFEVDNIIKNNPFLSDLKVMRCVENIKKLENELLSFPKELQINAFKNWNISNNIYLENLKVKIEKQFLIETITNKNECNYYKKKRL